MTGAELGPHTSRRGPRTVLRGFLGILTGTALAQLLAFAALPLLSRLYSPADTAHYALLLGIAAVLTSFATLRLELAIPIPASTDDSRGLFWLASLAPLVVLPVIGLLGGVLALTGLWHPTDLGWTDYLAIAAFVAALCLFSAAGQLAIRLRSYGLLARIPVLQMVGTLLAQCALGAINVSRGLFLGGLVGRSLGIVGLLRSCDVRLDQVPRRPEAARLVREYWRFPVIFAPANLVNVLGATIPPLMLPSLFGFGPAGLYAMADRITGVPVTVLNQSAGQVFLGEFARATTLRDSRRAFLRWSLALLLMALAVTAAIWVLAPLCLPWILGEEWSGTARLAQYAGIMSGAAIFGSPLQNVWTVRQRGLMQFAWNLVRLGANAAVLMLGARAGLSLAEVVQTLAVTTVGVYLLAWLGCLWAAVRPAAGQNRASEESLAGPDGGLVP